MIGARSMSGIARVGCGALGPGAVASRTHAHEAAGAGAANRSGPTGGAAKGTPRNRATPSTDRPRTRPAAVLTSTSVTSVSARPRRMSELGAVFVIPDVLPTLGWPREGRTRATLR